MQALIFDKKTTKLTYVKDHPVPELQLDTDIIVKVEYSGVCGTDLHIIKGAFPCNESRPIVMGHEINGTVVKAGPKSHFKIGDRVVVDPHTGCGFCERCHNAQYHMCSAGGLNATIGIFQDGGWAEFVKVPEKQALVLPETITMKQGGLCEPLSCVARGWDRISPVPVGSEILIMGAGIIGNLWAITFHMHGHRKITISETNEHRLKTVQNMDMGFICTTPDEIKSKNLTFDVIVDCTGISAAMEATIPSLKPCGKYAIFGCANPTSYAKVAPFEIFKKESTIIGINTNPHTFPKAIGFLESMGEKYLDYEKLGIKMFQLSEHETAFKELYEGTVSKVMFKLPE